MSGLLRRLAFHCFGEFPVLIGKEFKRVARLGQHRVWDCGGGASARRALEALALLALLFVRESLSLLAAEVGPWHLKLALTLPPPVADIFSKPRTPQHD